MFETSDLNTIKTLLANKPESVRLLEVDDNSISKRIKDIKKIAIEKKLKIEILIDVFYFSLCHPLLKGRRNIGIMVKIKNRF